MTIHPKFEQALKLLLEAVAENQTSTQPPLTAESMRAELAELAVMRGRPAFYPYLGAGVGRGAHTMLA
ncbi:MAG: hypothetical protein ACREQ4_06030, partial [Candidatus Binataceae bacterium]